MNKDIYKLALHECLVVAEQNSPNMLVTRVAGGWLYSYRDGSPVFVPFHNEFMKANHD